VKEIGYNIILAVRQRFYASFPGPISFEARKGYPLRLCLLPYKEGGV